MNEKAKSLGCVALIAFFGLNLVVNAASACDYATQVKLQQEANNINVNYEAKRVIKDERNDLIVPNATPDMVTFEGYYYFSDLITIYIMNITENLSVEITGDNGFHEIYTYDDTLDGTVEIDGGNALDIVNYDIRIKSEYSDCLGEEYAKKTLTTPKKNTMHDLAICETSNSYYCQEYVTVQINMTESEVIDRENSKKKEEQDVSKEDDGWFLQFIKENKGMIILGSLVIVIGVTSIVIFWKKKQRSKII